jgi:hypothetical protein
MFDHRTNIRKCAGGNIGASALRFVMAGLCQALPGHLVIARSAATKQSSAALQRWIASLRSQ